MINEDYIAEAKNVVKIYGKNKAEAAKMMEAGLDKDEVYRKTGAAVALWDVSFKVRRKEIFVIIGLSGSGKSTIIRCFNQLLKPTSGTILFEGQDVGERTRAGSEKRRRCAADIVATAIECRSGSGADQNRNQAGEAR